MSTAGQMMMSLGSLDGGSYEVGGNRATWKTRGKSNIIDLNFCGRSYTLTRQSRGLQGNDRFLVNGFRQPDGRRLQGADIPALVRKIDRFGDQLDRIEQIVTELRDEKIQKFPRLKGKLCSGAVVATWPQQRYIPRGSPGGFSRVPLAAVQASPQMAAGEYRILQMIIFIAQDTGLFSSGKHTLASLAKVAESDVKKYLRSLCLRQIIRPTSRILRNNAREYEILTHPWLCQDFTPELITNVRAGGNGGLTGEQAGKPGGESFPPFRIQDVKERSRAPRKGGGRRAIAAKKFEPPPGEFEKWWTNLSYRPDEQKPRCPGWANAPAWARDEFIRDRKAGPS